MASRVQDHSNGQELISVSCSSKSRVMSPTALNEALFLQLGEVTDVDMGPSQYVIKE